MTFTLPEPQKYGYIAKSENLYTEAQMLKLRDDTIAAMLRTQAAEIEQAIESKNGWLEAEIAWEVCASLHRKWAKGKDALFTTRQNHFVKHANDARQKAGNRN